mgnify:CR=1 FL=1
MYLSIHVYVYVSIVYMLCSPTLEEIKKISIYLSIYYLHLIKKYFTFIKSATVYFGVYVSTHIAKAICIHKAIPIAQFTSYHILN